ncbi:hypothetical protein OHA70_00150 [Kribbella sp. NBC_00382]|uniref:hypothetical protein n=1 Tax=Kribbella sp. NBC_00382 TaxID=2975967 RepID=UPI002E1B4E87
MGIRGEVRAAFSILRQALNNRTAGCTRVDGWIESCRSKIKTDFGNGSLRQL